MRRYRFFWEMMIFGIFCFLLPGPPLGAFSGEDYPENTEVRMLLSDLIFAPSDTILDAPPRVFKQRRSESLVRFRVETTRRHFYLVFINEWDYSFPLYSRGTYIIKRRQSDGGFVQLKIFYRTDQDSFLRIFPYGKRASMNVFLAGKEVYRDVILPVPFEQILTDSFQSIVDMTEATIDWDFLLQKPGTEVYTAIRHIVNAARKALPGLPDAEDGAMDSEGKLVFIEDLVLRDQNGGFNCSGFAKWIADGLYAPIAGKYLSIADLKQKHPGLRGNRWSNAHEDDRDPYFGLDWSRNIAMELAELDTHSSEMNREAADVRNVLFHDYIEDIGYEVTDIESLLYTLALQEPGYFYIGSVNTQYGKDPVLHQHVHLVVLFPYFDERGEFHLSLMERNTENDIDSLIKRYRDDHIHLVRIKARSNFKAAQIE